MHRIRCSSSLLNYVSRPKPTNFKRVKETSITSRHHSGNSNNPETERAESGTHKSNDTNAKKTFAPLAPLYLPSPPSPVIGWPTFWLARKDFEQYIPALYDRGWGVKFFARNNYLDSHDRYTAFLRTKYQFANFNCASEFIADLAVIAKQEKHHPNVIKLENGYRPTLTIEMQTDTALRPRWNEEDPTLDPPLPRRVPGITRRDIRFAIFLDQKYDEYYKSGKALELRGERLAWEYDRPTWEHLVSRFVRSSLLMKPPKDLIEREEMNSIEEYTSELAKKEVNTKPVPKVSKKEIETEPKQMVCHACGGPHKIQDCTVRAQHPPSTLCYFCLEKHWWLDCPERNSSLPRD